MSDGSAIENQYRQNEPQDITEKRGKQLPFSEENPFPNESGFGGIGSSSCVFVLAPTGGL